MSSCSSDDADNGGDGSTTGGTGGADGFGGSGGDDTSTASTTTVTAGGAGGSGAGAAGGSDAGAAGGSDAGGTGGSGAGAAGGSGAGGSTTGTNGTGATGLTGGSAGQSTAGEGGENAGGYAGESPEPSSGPHLTDLSIGGTRVPLAPAFDGDAFRYVAYPVRPPEPLTVTAVAASDLTITIAGEAAESGVPHPLPDLAPDTTFDVTVTDADGASRSYVVVYVPVSFPEFRVVVSKPEAATDPLYVTPASGGSRYVVKFDNDGVPLFYQFQPRVAFDFKKHANGLYSYAAAQGDGAALQLILDADYEQVDEVTTVGLGQTDEHEFLMLPNGNFVVLGYVRTVRDLTSYGGPDEFEVVDGVLQEITPARTVVFEWSTWENAPYDETLGRELDDYAHLNSVVIDADDNWIVSLRGLSQVIKIDRETGEVLWHFSGLANEFTIENDPYGGLCGQHAVSVLSNGNLLAFDNGQNCNPDLPARGEFSRVVEYSLDEENLTAELVWSYSREGLLADTQGSAQRLANGNTLIGWGNLGGRSAAMVTEVTPSGEVVFEVEAHLADGSIPVSYRAWRFAD